MIFINILQLYFINKNLNINPFSFDLFYLIILTGIGIYFALNQNYNFSLIHFILIPLLVYYLYFLLMLKPLARLLKELK